MYKLALVTLCVGTSLAASVVNPSGALDVSKNNKKLAFAALNVASTPSFTSICTSGGNGNFALVSTNTGNVPIGGAAALCASIGLTFADITTTSYQEALAVEYACGGINSGAWVRSWDTNTYGLPGLEMRTGSVVSASGVIVPPFSATNPVLCSGALIPTCASGRTPIQIPWSGSLSADGFGPSNNAFELDSNTLPNSGYKHNTITAPWVAFNGFGNPADFIRSGSGRWDARYVYATPAWREGLQVTFEGWRSGAKIYTKTVVLNSDKPYLVLLDFVNIDRLTLKGAGGTNVNYLGVGDGTQVSIENLNICV